MLLLEVTVYVNLNFHIIIQVKPANNLRATVGGPNPQEVYSPTVCVLTTINVQRKHGGLVSTHLVLTIE